MVLPRESANRPGVLERDDDPINPSTYRPPGNTVPVPLEPQRLDHQGRDSLGLAMSQQSRRVTRSRLNNSRTHPYLLGQRFRVSTPNEPSYPIRQISREPDVVTTSHTEQQPAIPIIDIHPNVRKRRWAANWRERKLLVSPIMQGERPEAVTALSASHDKKPFLAILDPNIRYSIIRASAVKVLQLQPMVLPKGSERSVFCSRWGVVNSELFVETMIGRMKGGKEEVCVGKIRVLDDKHNEDDENGVFGADMILRSDIFLMGQSELDVKTSSTPQPRNPSYLNPWQYPRLSPAQPSSSRVSSGTNDFSTVSVVYTPATSVQFANPTRISDPRHQAVRQQHDYQPQSQPRPPQLQHQTQPAHSQGSTHPQRRTQGVPNRRPQHLNEQQHQEQQQNGFMYSNGGYLAPSPAASSQGLHSHSPAPPYSQGQVYPRQDFARASLVYSENGGFMQADAGHMGGYLGNPNLD